MLRHTKKQLLSPQGWARTRQAWTEITVEGFVKAAWVCTDRVAKRRRRHRAEKRQSYKLAT